MSDSQHRLTLYLAQRGALVDYATPMLGSRAARKQMIDNSKFTTRAGISGESLSRVLISIPDIAEQEKISNALEVIDFRIESSDKKLKSVKSLKKSLMQDLLTGKVRVKVS